MTEKLINLPETERSLVPVTAAIGVFKDFVLTPLTDSEMLHNETYEQNIYNIARFTREYTGHNSLSPETQMQVDSVLEALLNFNVTDYYKGSQFDDEQMLEDRKMKLNNIKLLARAMYQHGLLYENQAFINAYQYVVLRPDFKEVNEYEIGRVCENITALIH